MFNLLAQSTASLALLSLSVGQNADINEDGTNTTSSSHLVDQEITKNDFNNTSTNCESQFYINVLVVTLVLVAIVNATFIALLIYRREIQVLLSATSGFRVFSKKQPEREIKSKKYDAYLSYNINNENFVVHLLLPGLEGKAIEKPYRLCIGERDFIGGNWLTDSITEAVNRSSRTIVALSQNYVENRWNQLEFAMAHERMMEGRGPRPVVIVLGDLVPRTLNPLMKLYLRTNAYLKWGEESFWRKLYCAMPELRVPAAPPTL